ncbi:diaminopimelate epimerase [uncultured Sphingomonas sp.]|uniref:diaminopimelate epimerase n=1 Tax=uncultured Sphingomonas sp. TaxID=158754 RepID=UPI0035CA0D85
MRIAFTKCHGAGNDFALVDARGSVLADEVWAGAARALSDRSGPVGSDGLLLLTDGGGAHAFGMRMFNPDGTEAETCLNGLRCVARAGFEAFDLRRAFVRLATSEAEVAVDHELAPGVYTVEERAGPARLDVLAWPMSIGIDRVVDAVVGPLSPSLRFTAVAMPNPHLIAFVEAVNDVALVRMGLLCEAAPDWLPNRANVSFVETREGGLFVRTHERGAGLTDACGSAMASTAVAAGLTGRAAFGTAITVSSPGGPVRARAEADGLVTLSGNATFEWTGEAEVDLAVGRVVGLVVTARFEAEIAAWDAARLDPAAAYGRSRPSDLWKGFMGDHKKKGDFAKNGVGGNKKQDNSDNTRSKDNNQNAGHGGHE